jgi:hypothetical protein
MAAFKNPRSNPVAIGHSPRGFLTLCWIPSLLILAVISNAPRALAQEGSSEFRAKAVSVLNFSRFIQWPDDAFSDPNEPMVIGIVGADLFGNQLPQAIAGKTVQGRGLVIHRYKAGDDMRGSHILFIGASETTRLPQILTGLRGSSVLTIGEMNRFVEAGGIIQISYKAGHVRFSVGLNAANGAHLKVSSKLLRVAEYVATNATPDGNGESHANR